MIDDDGCRALLEQVELLRQSDERIRWAKDRRWRELTQLAVPVDSNEPHRCHLVVARDEHEPVAMLVKCGAVIGPSRQARSDQSRELEARLLQVIRQPRTTVGRIPDCPSRPWGTHPPQARDPTGTSQAN